jgi:hypothetical protein
MMDDSGYKMHNAGNMVCILYLIYFHSWLNKSNKGVEENGKG